MKYNVEFSDKAKEHITKMAHSGDKKSLKKLYALISELEDHPTTGTGKPELLKHYADPTWSRRISDKHRLVYRIYDDVVVVLVLSAIGHYDDN